MFEANSYGFLPGRSCHDAIAQCFNHLRQGIRGGDTRVLDAELQGFFDNIAHESILNRIDTFPCGKLIKGWLQAGFIEPENFNPTKTGTPQGGVISPLLANIGLHGARNIHQTK